MDEPIGLDRNGERIYFGTVDTGSAETLRAMPGETTESLDAWIQSRRQFKDRVPGIKGVWLESERLGKVIVGHENDGKFKWLMGMGAAYLRDLLAKAGKAFPMSASDQELAAAAAALDASKIGGTPAAQPAAPAMAVEPVAVNIPVEAESKKKK